MKTAPLLVMLKAVCGTYLVFTDGKEKAKFEKLLNMESLQPLTNHGQKVKTNDVVFLPVPLDMDGKLNILKNGHVMKAQKLRSSIIIMGEIGGIT